MRYLHFFLSIPFPLSLSFLSLSSPLFSSILPSLFVTVPLSLSPFLFWQMPTLHGKGVQTAYGINGDAERGRLEETRDGTFENGRLVQGEKTLNHWDGIHEVHER